MILAYLLLLTGLTISAVAIYYSVVGLTAIFSAAVIPIIVMGASLEVAKLVCASWLKANWERAPRFIKYYMVIAVVVLMLITSMGIFGFLSKAHNDQNLVSGDVQSKIAIYDEKIKTAKDNIDANRKALKQMDEAVDQVMGRSSDEKGAEKAVAIRRSQQKERARLQSEIATEQKIVAAVSEERSPIAAEVRKVEAEVGPIKYIAKFLYGEHGADENMLEQAVTWIIILIVVVFDPLAVIMLLAAQMSFGWTKKQDDWIDDQAEELTEAFNQQPVADEILAQGVTNSNPADNIPVVEEPTIDYKFVEEEHEPDYPTTLTADTTVTTTDAEPEPEFPMPIEQWNAMIAEAEAQAEAEAKNKYQILPELQKHIDESTVEERVARGDSYIDTQGTEVNLEEEPSKKKTYMTKDPEGRIITKNRP
jgi:Fe2+ transport system protein B